MTVVSSFEEVKIEVLSEAMAQEYLRKMSFTSYIMMPFLVGWHRLYSPGGTSLF